MNRRPPGLDPNSVPISRGSGAPSAPPPGALAPPPGKRRSDRRGFLRGPHAQAREVEEALARGQREGAEAAAERVAREVTLGSVLVLGLGLGFGFGLSLG